jgi:pimeloyl-ACP methyl ester carboxylesterase
MKPKVVHYPIPGNPTGGILHIYGEPAATQDIVLYCGGFPDGLGPISELAERLAKTRDGQDRQGCYVGVTCFPGFDYDTFNEQKFNGFKKSGFTFDEVTCCVRDAADLLFKEHAKSESSTDEYKTTFTLMTHDWGAAIGHLFINRAIEERTFTQHKPDRLVMLDVLLFPHPKSNYKEVLRGSGVYIPTARDHLFSISYRTIFAISFAMLQLVSETFGLVALGILSSVVFKILKLNPLSDVDSQHMKSCMKDPKHFLYMMYPYYHMYREVFKGSTSVFNSTMLPLDLKQTPILYIYGAKKNVMFHDYRSVALLEREEKEGLSESRVVRLEESGHWMYCQEPEICENEIRKFLRGGSEASSGNKHSRL